MDAGVYAITSMTSLQTYIGSTVNVRARWHHHRVKFRKGDHPCAPLQEAWARGGEPLMLFTVLEYTPADPRVRIPREQWWLDHTPDAMNVYRRAAQSGPLGKTQSARTRAKIRKAHIGRKHTAEHVEKHANAIRGKKNPGVSRARHGVPLSAEHRARIAASLLGQKRGPYKKSVASLSADIATGHHVSAADD
jgi:group I intron endonuclease